MVRAALYYRVSTDTQAEEGYGLDVQRDACRAEAIQRGYSVVEEYSDEGVSGTLFDRPDLERLLEAARAKVFDVVLCYRTSRLARDMFVKLRIKDALKKLGVKVEYVNAKFDDTVMGEAFELFNDLMDHVDRRSITEQMAKGRRKKAMKGLVVFPGNPPYGYEADPANPKEKLRICQPAHEAMLFARQLCLEGKSLRKIIAAFNELRIPAPRGQWGHTSILRILTDERYLGKIYYGAEKVVGGKRVKGREPLPVSIPSIWTQEQLDQHKAAFFRNKNVMVGRPAEFKYPLLKMIRCDVCGRRYDGSPSHGHRYYRHMTPSECKGPWLNADVVEKKVWLAIHKAFQDPVTLREAANAYEAARGVRIPTIVIA